jgi:hypothetical protein
VSYFTRRLRAVAVHSRDSHWVDLAIVQQGVSVRAKETLDKQTVFFAGPHARDMADAYADAINAVDEKFHPAALTGVLADFVEEHAA